MRSCCCNAASGLASPEAEAARRVRGDVTTAPNVGAGLAGRDEDPPPPPPLPALAPLAEANRPAASEVHDAGVAGRDDDDEGEGEGEDGACTCTWESSCTARLSAATSCSRSSRLRANGLCARATVGSPVPSTNALELLRRECALRRGELRVQRGRRRCVARGERLERLLQRVCCVLGELPRGGRREVGHIVVGRKGGGRKGSGLTCIERPSWRRRCRRAGAVRARSVHLY